MSPAASLVLLFHRIGSFVVRSIVWGQYVPPLELRWQLQALRARGYRATTLAEIIADPAVPGRMALTFDDAYLSVQTGAIPVLAEMQIPATIFAVAALVGKTNRWDQAKGDRSEPLLDVVALRELAAAGVEIGSHTLTHARLTELSGADLRAEVRDSKHVLEDLLGRPVHGFSYPYGAWDARIRDEVIEAGYRYATATTLRVVDGTLDPFAIPRMNMRWNTLGPEMQHKIKRAYRKAEE